MKKLTFSTIQARILLGVLLVCVSLGCAKEDFSIQDVPYDELESSFFEYSADAIVIDYENLESIVIDKSEDNLLLSKSNGIENIEVGSVIVTSSNTPHDDFILREVLTVQDNGDSYSLGTEVTTPYRAYSSYYYNSSLDETIELRDRKVLYDLASLKGQESDVQSGFANLFNSFTDQIKDILVSKLPPAASKPYKLAGFFGFAFGGSLLFWFRLVTFLLVIIVSILFLFRKE